MKQRIHRWVFPVLMGLPLLLALGWLALPRQDLKGWEPAQELSWAWERKLKREVLNIAGDYPAHWEEMTDGEKRDSIEDCLIRLGYAVENTQAGYPSYLANPQGLEAFWEAASAGKDADTAFLRISENGDFGLSCFLRDRGETCCVLVSVFWEEGRPCVRFREILPVYDMVLADWGTFYYRLYPEDPHYIDYMQLRILPPDKENYDLCRKYILPIGYQMVNFFLVDWEEGNWGELSFPDVFEYLYEQKTGKPCFPWTEYADPDNAMRGLIPTELFEETMLPFFRISREELRERSGWKEGGFPWRTFFGDDITSRSYPMCEPVVTGSQDNGDGTFTLSVRVGSPEKKTDCLFSHEVTIRPLRDGGWQYVSNRMTEVREWGLPYHESRFMLDS